MNKPDIWRALILAVAAAAATLGLCLDTGNNIIKKSAPNSC
jgi:hypothetical protein